jgi:predicted NACHT family NTPase
LSDIYTDVNILEKITHNQRKEIEELRAICGFEEFDRWRLSGIRQKRVEGIAAVRNHSKLMILGKPGAGKTTFLKFLAMSCISGKAFADLVPIFVTLKDFADRENRPSLLQFLTGEFSQWDIEVEPILKSGRALVLLDGLDEVRAEYDDRVLREIREFVRNYSESQIVVTCRIAANQYVFEQFTEVEVADFDEQQIATFVENWFRNKEIKTKDFLEELKKYRGVQELATSPLLLTLLCLAFEESGSFPTNRSELYKEGLDALLRKWDSKRGIRRDSVYKDLSVQKKEDMLSQIALTTFEKGDYFVKQRQLEDYICDYIRNTANAKTDDEELHLDSEAVLKSIEAQHGLFVERARGIYSFSHLTFHEYFAARQIVVSTSPSKLETAFQNLVTHVTDKRWREVILLSVGMARKADDLLLLMKRKIDSLLEDDEKLQSFLAWTDEKSRSVNAPYKLVATRVHYFALAHSFGHSFARALDCDLARDRDLDFDGSDNLSRQFSQAFRLAYDLDRNLEVAIEIDSYFAQYLDSEFVFFRACYLNYNLSCHTVQSDIFDSNRLCQHMQSLRDRLPDPNQDWNAFKEWWKQNGKEWIAEYRQMQIEYHKIATEWQFTLEQDGKLNQYYEANKLLVECLKSDCYVSPETRQAIEESLLLPSVSSKR